MGKKTEVKENPLITIVVPCYNQAEFLSDALDSLLAQTYMNWECILVNDGSQDDTELIANHYCIKDARFQYIYQNNGGVSSARNVGISIGKGDYFQFLDCDDLLETTKLEFQIKQLKEFDFKPKIISVTKHLYFIDNDRTHIDVENSTDIRLCHDYDNPTELLIDSWRFLSGFNPNSWLWHRELVLRAGDWDVSLAKNEDGEYYSRILPLADSVLFCSNTHSYYRYNSNSACNVWDDGRLMDQQKSVRMIVDRIKTYRFDADVKDVIYKMYMFYMYPTDGYPLYLFEFKKDLKSLGYNFDLVDRGNLYKFLYFCFGKKVADLIFVIKNTVL